MDWGIDKIGGQSDKVYLQDKVDVLELTNEFKLVRMIGPSRRVMEHSIEIVGKTNKKEVRIPKMCLGWNEETKEIDGKCPYCDIDPGNPRMVVYSNVIDRDLQDAMPERPKPPTGKELKAVDMHGYKCFLKDGKKSKAWTPCRLWRITPSPGGKISDLASLNKKKIEGEVVVCGPNHLKHGFDLNVKYDKNKAPAEQYAVIKADASTIDAEERRYLLHDIDTEQPEEMKVAKVEAKRLAEQMKIKPDSDEDDESEETNSRGKKASSGKRKPSNDDDDDWNSDDDFEDEKPARGKKTSSKNSRRDEVDDEFDDEPEEKPRGRRSRREEPDDDEPEEKPKRRRSRDDDDDLEEKPRRKRRTDDDDDVEDKPKRRAKPSVDDDWDD